MNFRADNIRLKFEIPEGETAFRKMIGCLSGFISYSYPDSIFVADMEQSGLRRFSNSFLGPSNRLSGCLVDKNANKTAYTIWCYYDQEYAHNWIFCEEGPLFGEVVL